LFFDTEEVSLDIERLYHNTFSKIVLQYISNLLEKQACPVLDKVGFCYDNITTTS
jgi:hypothetical protein